MTQTVQLHDFVEIDYTGMLPEGNVFDTTSSEVAKKHGFHSEKGHYHSTVICVGEKQVLAGLDEQLINKEVGKTYTIKLLAEQAFGKRDVKKLQIVPLKTFEEHKVNPYPGLQIDVDGQMGFVTKVMGGRIIVNFNHPLAGKDVVYEVTIHRKVTDPVEKIKKFFETTLHVHDNQMKVELVDNKAVVELPFTLPQPLIDAFVKKLVELTQVKDIIFSSKKV